MRRCGFKLVALAVFGLAPLALSAKGLVAGLQPYQRPTGAPVISTFPVDQALKAKRLQGISAPLPGNVDVIAAQGAWFNPMFRPGMTGPYDIRQLHVRK